jgi:hypothetical protein
MGGNQYFYFNTIRAITVAFSDLFNNIHVERKDDDGNVAKYFKLPLTFGPVNKYQFVKLEKESGKKYYLQLPRLAITLEGFKYNAERATGVNEIRHLLSTSADMDLVDRFITSIQPTPYDFSYSLHVFTETLDEFNQVLEQIIPFFNPATHLRLKEFGSLNLERDIKVSIEGMNVEYINPQEEDEKRQINGTLTFNAQAFMYRPLTDAAIIKEIRTKYFVRDTDVTSAGVEEVNILAEQYNTSGFSNVSAAPDTSAYDFSATFDYIDVSDNSIKTGGAFTSAIRGD